MTDQEAYALTERLISLHFPDDFQNEIYQCYLDTWWIISQPRDESFDIDDHFRKRISECISEISISIIYDVDMYIQKNFPFKQKQMKDYATNWYMALLDVERAGFINFSVLYRVIYLALTDKIADEKQSTPFVDWMNTQFEKSLKSHNSPQNSLNVYCSNCGTENRPDANFCKKCGSKLS